MTEGRFFCPVHCFRMTICHCFHYKGCPLSFQYCPGCSSCSGRSRMRHCSALRARAGHPVRSYFTTERSRATPRSSVICSDVPSWGTDSAQRLHRGEASLGSRLGQKKTCVGIVIVFTVTGFACWWYFHQWRLKWGNKTALEKSNQKEKLSHSSEC